MRMLFAELDQMPLPIPGSSPTTSGNWNNQKAEGKLDYRVYLGNSKFLICYADKECRE